MPELPEVETVRATLEAQLQSRVIEDVEVLWRKIVDQELDEFKRICHQRIIQYDRYGKYLLFRCEDVTLIVHLRMEGKFYILEDEKPYDKHVHVIFKMDNGQYLQYHDTRKFGRMKVVDNDQVDDYFSNYLEYMDTPYESQTQYSTPVMKYEEGGSLTSIFGT